MIYDRCNSCGATREWHDSALAECTRFTEGDPMTTQDEIRTRLHRGKAEGATHVIVVCDTFDHEDYPHFVKPGEDPRAYKPGEMQRIMECYALHLDLEVQIAEYRSFHYEEPPADHIKALIVQGYESISNKYRMVARLPAGKTGIEAMSEVDPQYMQLVEKNTAEQYRRVHAKWNTDEVLELSASDYVEFRKRKHKLDEKQIVNLEASLSSKSDPELTAYRKGLSTAAGIAESYLRAGNDTAALVRCLRELTDPVLAKALLRTTRTK